VAAGSHRLSGAGRPATARAFLTPRGRALALWALRHRRTLHVTVFVRLPGVALQVRRILLVP
jgi:hypothetical protein